MLVSKWLDSLFYCNQIYFLFKVCSSFLYIAVIKLYDTRQLRVGKNLLGLYSLPGDSSSLSESRADTQARM